MDNHGFKIDLILNKDFIQPIEIKASTYYNFSADSYIRKFLEIVKEAKRPTVIYAGKQILKQSGIDFVNFKNMGASVYC
jgi:hypothetical protein